MLYPVENQVREVKNLSGIWRFKVDKRDEGFTKGWFKESLKDTISMSVPASYNDVVTDESIREHIGFVWYETETVIPNSWDGRRMVIRIGSATHHGVVFIDGVEVVRHKGGYLPFEADITNLVKAGNKIRITIAVSNVLDWTCIPCGEIITNDDEKRYPKGYKYQETYFDFYNYSGLHRPVKLYVTPKNYIEDITVDTKLHANEAVVNYDIKLSGNVKNIIIKVIDEQDNVVSQQSGEVSEADNNVVCGNISVLDPHLWQPGAAYLYKLVVEADEDLYTQTFGIRTIKVDGDKFLINGKPFYFKGFGKHEDSDIHGKGLDEALNIKDFNLLKWMGANSFRTSHYPYSEEILNLADREGMVIIGEVPAVGMCFWDGRQAFR